MDAKFDKEEMKELIMGKELSQELLKSLPDALYEGKLTINRFVSATGPDAAPPRLLILVAMYMHTMSVVRKEVVYQTGDYPWCIFLVCEGVFAHIAMPTQQGGRAATREDFAVESKSSIGRSYRHVDVDAVRTEEGFPYQLFCRRSYFGDIEIFLRQPRSASIRCETKGGELLSLHKKDLNQIITEFPQFAAAWKLRAYHHASTRASKQRQLVRGRDYKNFAATIIQRVVRSRRLEKDGQASPAKPIVLNLDMAETKHANLGAKIDSLHKDVARILEHLERSSTPRTLFSSV